MKPDLTLPEKLCRYVVELDEVRDIRTNATVGGQLGDLRRDGYQYATDWFATKVKEVQDYFNRNEDARRRHPFPPMLIVAEAVFIQLIAEGRVAGGFAVHAS